LLWNEVIRDIDKAGRFYKMASKGDFAMVKNMGSADRIIRVLLAVVIAFLFFTKQITGTLGIILAILAVVFLLTSLAGFCPLYVPFKISTKKKVS